MCVCVGEDAIRGRGTVQRCVLGGVKDEVKRS